ncbi:Rab-GTPase-TBC domain [Pseudocohnilembus persalinus]|uniref:Rab-GTPase-TBC domain n=1 Tax=Pseudocohnilembus persalinus TaxID=266149 RepID=A0A0V0QQ49_PSEPJ|nr:Rab-GTPase-TBC domain [Pseudocohnilembus persalinus]|eukprot:KRX04300.1 Rab-GTPase-TBC domain [Pseudocohnilembus persalinus]
MKNNPEEKDRKIKKRIRKGIPQAMRQKVWPILAEVEKFKKEQIQEQTNSDTKKNGNNQDQYLESELQQQLGIIDAKQNSPQVSQEQNQKALTQKQREEEERTMGQNSLNNILKALSISCKDMGYCQGLNFVGASLLIYVNDEEAFWIMFSLMNKKNSQKNVKIGNGCNILCNTLVYDNFFQCSALQFICEVF